MPEDPEEGEEAAEGVAGHPLHHGGPTHLHGHHYRGHLREER